MDRYIVHEDSNGLPRTGLAACPVGSSVDVWKSVSFPTVNEESFPFSDDWRANCFQSMKTTSFVDNERKITIRNE